MQAKFADTFCATCNNARSQPFDRAYDQFIAWFLGNERAVEATGVVNLDAAYQDWTVGTHDLLRYFVKHIACRIAEAGYSVPDSLRCYLDGTGDPTGLVCSFEIDAVFVEINAIMRENPTAQGTSGNLFLGPVTGDVQRSDGHATTLRGWWGYHGLQVVWEWSVNHTGSWTNLSAPTVRLPITRRRQAVGLHRAGKPGLAGIAWRGWYRLRRLLGVPPKLSDA